MANAKDFVERVGQIEGVAGCLLTKKDGVLLGQSLNDPEVYAALMQISAGQAFEIMDKIGFSYCRHICFNRKNNLHFYVFPIDNFLLGVVQNSDCDVSEMLDAIYLLISRVRT